MKLSMKKLEILKENIKFRGGLLGLKDFMMILELLLLRILRVKRSVRIKRLLDDKEAKLIKVLKNHKEAIAWSIADIKGIDSSFCAHKILIEEEYKPTAQPQRRANPTFKKVVKKEVIKLLGADTVFREPPYPFDYPMRRLSMEEILAKFIDEGRREHEEMDIFIKEFRTINELLLKTRSNSLSELKIEVNELSNVVSNVLIPKNKVKGVTTRGGKMTSEATHSKEINETGINKNEPLKFEQDVQEKQHDDGVENKSLSILEKAAHPLVKPQQPSIPFPKRSLVTNKSILEEACTETMNERCSAVLLNELPLKEKDPTSFTIPSQVIEKHKEAEDLAVDHSSRLENPHMEVLTEREIADKFFDEHLMALKSKSNNDEPWYANFVNYIVGKVVPPNWTFEKRKRFFSQVKTYFWEEPYAFKLCADNIMRRCVAGSETL
ncbi:hypothetical protein Tco_0468840 [Tanacetum coccineum]